MKIKLAAILTAFCLTCSYASAMDIINCDIADSGTISLKNTLPSKKEGSVVSILVFRPNMSYENLSGENDNILSVAENNQTESGAGGEYTFTFAIDGESDFYNVRIASDAKDEQAFQFLYSDPEQGKALLRQLNVASSADSFYNVIYGADEGWKSLGFYLSFPVSADQRKTSDLLYQYITKVSKFDETNMEAAKKLFGKMYVIELLNESKNLDLSELEKYLDVKSEKFYEYYNKAYITDSVKKGIYSALQSKGFTSYDEYKAELLKQLILTTVKNSDGYGNIRDILKAFETETKISTTDLSGENYTNALGNSYADYAALETALKKSNTSSGTTGKSSSSKSSSALPGNSIAIEKTLVDAPVANPIAFEEDGFSDLSGVEWAKTAINALHEKGIVSGKTSTLFCPNDNISREEFAAVIVKAMKLTDENSQNSFSDVDETAWYAKAIKAAAANGIIFGKDDGNFGVGESITRQDIAVMLARAKAMQKKDENVKFNDDATISNYAIESVYLMRSNGIISGFEDGTFRPSDFATRAQAAVMVYNALNK